jgi:hypothetical protein
MKAPRMLRPPNIVMIEVDCTRYFQIYSFFEGRFFNRVIGLIFDIPMYEI